MSDINAQVQLLAVARRNVAYLKRQVEQLKDDLAATKLGKQLAFLEDELTAAKEDERGAYDNLCGTVLEEYSRTGNKQPHPATQVKTFTVLDYDPAEALDYAKKELTAALKLDKKTFEKVAREVDLAFVAKIEEPRVYVSRDLYAMDH